MSPHHFREVTIVRLYILPLALFWILEKIAHFILWNLFLYIFGPISVPWSTDLDTLKLGTYSLILFFCLFKKNLFFYFIYFWLHWVFVVACGLSLVATSGGYSSLQCAGFSLRWLLLLWSTGSRHAGFNSCGMRA